MFKSFIIVLMVVGIAIATTFNLYMGAGNMTLSVLTDDVANNLQGGTHYSQSGKSVLYYFNATLASQAILPTPLPIGSVLHFRDTLPANMKFQLWSAYDSTMGLYGGLKVEDISLKISGNILSFDKSTNDQNVSLSLRFVVIASGNGKVTNRAWLYCDSFCVSDTCSIVLYGGGSSLASVKNNPKAFCIVKQTPVPYFDLLGRREVNFTRKNLNHLILLGNSSRR